MAPRLSEGTLVRHPDTGSPTFLAAGTEVPEWADGLVGDHLIAREPDTGDDRDSGDNGIEDAGYGDLTVAELKAEIAARNEGRDEADQIPDEGKKADLVAALEADDES